MPEKCQRHYDVPMRKPGTDENNVQTSDVLCDFCHAEWTEDRPMLEGHQGSCICGNCLSIAYREVILHRDNPAGDAYRCVMCLESEKDRAAINRAGEAGWRSPMYDEAAICQRCIKLASGALHKDRDSGWKKPASA